MTTWDVSMRSNSAVSATEDACLDTLCDDVMQRLFATGVGIDAIVGQLPDSELAARLARHVADLDDTIAEIRARTVGLRAGTRAVSVVEHHVPSTASARDVVS
jgi:hypothetical protein